MSELGKESRIEVIPESNTRLIPIMLPNEKARLTTIDANDPAVAFYDAGAAASVRLFSEVLELTDKGLSKKVKGVGSGALVSPDGLVLTCEHVVKDCSSFTAELITGEKVNATPVAHFPEADLALVQIEGKKDLSHLKMGRSGKLKYGEGTAIFGHPLGSQNVFVSVGNIYEVGSVKDVFGEKSPVDAMPKSQEIVRISSHAERGSSGSPVVNKKGEVIGVTFAVNFDKGLNGEEEAKSTYVVPVDTLKKTLKSHPELYKKLHWN
ncbi:MAG: serine protease [Candidatus Obscuribacterales bacterium]|nr:serine protease [Candidatus Obscuribacterales bacterium]